MLNIATKSKALYCVLSIEGVVANSCNSISNNNTTEQATIVRSRRDSGICNIGIYNECTTTTCKCRLSNILNTRRDNNSLDRGTILKGILTDSCQLRGLAKDNLCKRATIIEGTITYNPDVIRECHTTQRCTATKGTHIYLLNALT